MYVRDSEGARCLKVGVGVHEKPDSLEAFHESADARVWRQILGSSLSQKKMNLGLADAISRCLEGLICSIQSLLSRYASTFSIPLPTPPSLFLNKFGQINPRTPMRGSGRPRASFLVFLFVFD